MTKELTIFNYHGKNYIGYLCTAFSNDTPSFLGIGTTVTNVYVFQGPCEISYKLSITSDATADLTSVVMPIFPGGFYNGDKTGVYFAFPKADVVLSTIKAANIHQNIVNQFKQLTGLS